VIPTSDAMTMAKRIGHQGQVAVRGAVVESLVPPFPLSDQSESMTYVRAGRR
jgi:hypothetical protein